MADNGFKLTRPTQNVLLTKRVQDYILHSGYNTLKVWKKITDGVNMPTSTTTTRTYFHRLGYTPACLVFYKLKGTSENYFCDNTKIASGALGEVDNKISCQTFIDDEKISFEIVSGANSGDVALTCLIFADSAENVAPSTIGIPYTRDWGMKISKPGVNVFSARPHQLILNSFYENLKFHMDKTVQFTVAAAGTEGTVTFDHGLGYVPAFVGMIEDPSDSNYHSSVPRGRVPQPFADTVYADTSTITCAAVKIPTGGDITFKYRIIVFKDRIN